MSSGSQAKFYNSKVWKEMRKTIWIQQNLLCNRCHKPVYVDGISEWIPREKRRTGIVHHKIYLDNSNIYDDNISLDENNLEGLCKECHESEHHQDISKRSEYIFDEEGNLIPKSPPG